LALATFGNDRLAEGKDRSCTAQPRRNLQQVDYKVMQERIDLIIAAIRTHIAIDIGVFFM